MDLETCLKKLQYIGVLAFATVDLEGAPQIRNISAIHYEKDAIYFFTARGKEFCRELLEDGRVQILGYSKYKEMIRLSSRAKTDRRRGTKKMDGFDFAEQPYLANVYPGKTRDIGIIFEIRDAQIEYFHLGVSPIFPGKRIYWDVESKTKQEKCRGSRSRRRRARKKEGADERISYHRCMYRVWNMPGKLSAKMY